MAPDHRKAGSSNRKLSICSHTTAVAMPVSAGIDLCSLCITYSVPKRPCLKLCTKMLSARPPRAAP